MSQQYPFTPLCVSAVRNGVPLPDWDGDVEKWAMSAHAPIDRVAAEDLPDGQYIVIEGLGMFVEEPELPAWLMEI